jgi:hypothetical protein
MTVLDCIIMLLIDCVLYFFLVLYLDKVVPGEFGRTKPPFFFLKTLFSRKKEKRTTPQNETPIISEESDFELVDNQLNSHEALK